MFAVYSGRASVTEVGQFQGTHMHSSWCGRVRSPAGNRLFSKLNRIAEFMGPAPAYNDFQY